MKSKIEKAKTIILPITGGIGRNIFATAMIENFKLEYPDKQLIIVAGYPEVFFNNPNIRRVHNFNNTQYLFEETMFQNPDTILLEVEPYRHPDYINGNMHVVEAWCEMLQIPYKTNLPKLYLTRNELEIGKSNMDHLRIKHNRPVILIQPCGGKMSDKADPTQQIADLGMMQRRSLRDTTIQELSDLIAKEGYTPAIIAAPNQFSPNGGERVSLPLRALFALVSYADGIIAIDSFLQHTAAALDVKSLVLWMGTSPERLGYKLHKNLRRNSCKTPECHRPNSYAFDIQPNGFPWDCPFSDACRDYDAKFILKEYKDMKGKEFIKTLRNFKKVEQPKVITTQHEHTKDTVCPAHGRK